MTNPLFVSYRRSDTTGEAGRLADSLENLLGAACVFRDVDDIPPGQDFESVLKQELAGTRAVVVLIGKRWLAELRKYPDRFTVHELYAAYPDGKIDVAAEYFRHLDGDTVRYPRGIRRTK